MRIKQKRGSNPQLAGPQNPILYQSRLVRDGESNPKSVLVEIEQEFMNHPFVLKEVIEWEWAIQFSNWFRGNSQTVLIT